MNLKALLPLFLMVLSTTSLSGQMPALEMMGDKNEVSFPFEYFNNFLVVDVVLKEALPLKFIFDTGAENTILFEKTYSDLLGIPTEQEVKIYGADLSQTINAFICRRVLLRLDHGKPFRSDIIVLEEDIYKMEHYLGLDIAGVLGSNLFCGLILEIDYRAKKIKLKKPQKGKKPGRGYTYIDMDVQNCKPYVHLPTISNGSKSDSLRYLIDTGAGVSMLVHNNTHESLSLPPNYIKGHLGFGIGGKIEGYLGRMQKISIGDYAFNNAICNYQDLDSIALANLDMRRNGLIGNIILRRFDIILDYSQNKFGFRPNKNYKKAIKVNRSGMYLLATGHNFDQYIVHHVIPGSPSYLAGVKRGDLIHKMNGIQSNFLSLGGILRRLQKKPGKKMRFVLKRDTEKIKVEFELKDLI